MPPRSSSRTLPPRARAATLCIASLIALLSRDVTFAQNTPPPTQPFEFTRMVAHWIHYDRPDYLEFIRDAEPEIVQVGFYGAHFWSLAHTPQYKEYPAHFPVRGINEASAWFAEFEPRRGNSLQTVLNVLMAGSFSALPSWQ